MFSRILLLSILLRFPYLQFFLIMQFHPRLNLVVSGSFDGILRIFDRKSRELYEYHGDHSQLPTSVTSTAASAYSPQYASTVISINSLTFSNDGDRLFTVDSRGVIRVWQLLKELQLIPNNKLPEFNLEAFVAEKRRQDKIHHDSNPLFACVKILTHGDLADLVLGSVDYNQFGGERLLVYARDSVLYLFNAFTFAFFCFINISSLNLRVKLVGATCQSMNLPCILSPDGTKAMAASEDGKCLCLFVIFLYSVYFWDCQSGHLLKELNVNLHVPINSIAWHPSQHLIVFSSFGSDYPIFFFEYVPSDDVYK